MFFKRKEPAMKLISFILPLAALALAAPAAYAETPAPQAEARQNARIPFVNHGGIRDWRVDDSDTLYIQARNRDWYKATLMMPSFDLPYVFAIGFDTGPIGTLDKFSSIVVRGQRYPIASLERIPGEPPKKQKDREDA
jgi:hypothetical protein